MKATTTNALQVRGTIRFNESMKKHTAWRAGGCADCYFQPADIDDLCDLLKQIPKNEPILWVGLGSNLLVRDKGFRGTIIAFSKGLGDMYLCDKTYIYVGTGATCAKVARMSAKFGLTGGEFLAGIPGTIGGALAMNAGAFGHETWDIVDCVETINRQGCKVKRKKEDFDIAYRHVNLSSNEWFISAKLSFHVDEDKKSSERIRTLLNERAATQPIGEASCGSVFRNPDSVYAAKLIEESGLKGRAINDAYVSEKHSNFIINSGNASASDIESLISLVQKKVKQNSGIELVPEVVIIGDSS